MRAVLAAASIALAAAPAFARSSPAPPLRSQIALLQSVPSYVPTLPPGFPALTQPILPAATPTPMPTITPTPAGSPQPPQPIAPSPSAAAPTPTPSLPAAVADRPSATPRAVASVPGAILAAPTATPGPIDALSPLYVKGQILTISAGFVIFTSGDSLRVASGVVIPPGVTTGSYVRVSLDQVARLVTAIELEPKNSLPGEVDAANVPRQYVVVSPKSAPLPAATGQAGASGNALVTITIVVHVPGNTPTSDDVYLATERSQYSPAEVRMDRVDATTWSATVSLANGTALKYQFTRGTYATVERDRTGGIVPPHVATGTQNFKSDDTVIRWADLS